MVCDANGVPLRFMLSPGRASDIAYAQPVLKQVRLPENRDANTNVVAGYWLTRGMTPSIYVTTATVTECSR